VSDYRARVHADTLRIRAAHQPSPRGSHCRICGERYPCGAARMAGRALDAFGARMRRRQSPAGPPAPAVSPAGDGVPTAGDGGMRLGDVPWTRSIRCGGVEVAFVDDVVAVRNAAEPFGPMLLHTRVEWEAFVAAVKAGQFDDTGTTGCRHHGDGTQPPPEPTSEP